MNISIKPLDNQEFNHENNSKIIAIPKNDKYFTYLLISQKGGGKTTLIINLLENYFRKYYNNIFLFSTTAKFDKKWKKIIKELEETEHFYDKLNDNDMQDAMDKMIDYNEEHPKKKSIRNLCIFDDVLSMMPNSMITNNPFNLFMLNNRHYKCDIIITAQKYTRLNSNIRANFDIISIFPTVNKKEIKSYIDEINVDKDSFLEHYQKILDDDNPHSFLTINLQDKLPKFFNCFEKITN